MKAQLINIQDIELNDEIIVFLPSAGITMHGLVSKLSEMEKLGKTELKALGYWRRSQEEEMRPFRTVQISNNGYKETERLSEDDIVFLIYRQE